MNPHLNHPRDCVLWDSIDNHSLLVHFLNGNFISRPCFPGFSLASSKWRLTGVHPILCIALPKEDCYLRLWGNFFNLYLSLVC